MTVRGRPWKKGQSGNPAGNKPGKPDWRGKLRGMFESNGPELVQKSIDLALEGDMTAMRLCIDRIVPALKSRDDWAGIPVKPNATLLEQVQSAKAAAMGGAVSPVDAGALVRLVILEGALVSAAEGGRGLSAEDVIRLLNSEIQGSQ